MAELSTPHDVLKKTFGYDTFRPLQEAIIQAVLAGRDSLVIMPTGGGKSVCYQIPAIIKEGTFVVISPLISLMKDQVESLRANGIEAAYINSSLEAREESIEIKKLESGQLKLLYLSPEKLQTASMYRKLQASKISGFAIDEAHCISAWGHDFREEYGKLGFIKQKWPDLPVVALTATADKITRRDIVHQLNLDNPEIFLSSFNRPNLSLAVKSGQQVYRQVKNIVDRHRGEPGIIYCLSRKTCEEVAAKLNFDGHKAAYYHAGLEAKKRAQVQEEFTRDQVPVIVATIAFGMGIDKSNVRFVIHYNLPKNIEGYYQEIGRGGRDGLSCETVMFYSYRDVMILTDFAEASAQKEIQLAKLKRIQQFAEAAVCRRKILLSYFGEDLKDDCGNCDVCKNPPEVGDGTTIVQMALSALKRLNENVGIGTLIDVLRGSQKTSVFESGFQHIKTYGAGKDISYTDWQHHILQMLHQGFIEIAYDQKHVLKVTEAGNEVLFNGRKVKMVNPAAQKETYTPYVQPVRKKTKKEQFEDELFNVLHELRKQIADSKGVPPYVIFSDATLKQMAEKLPVNHDELSEISGVGAFKLKEYGDTFLYEIHKAMASSSHGGSTIKGKTYIETLIMIRDGKSVPEIAKTRNVSESTIYSHLAQLLDKLLIHEIDSYLTGEEMKLIEEAVKAHGETDTLKPLFDHMGGSVDYGKIKLFLSYQNMIKG